MGMIEKKAAVTDESAAVSDEGLIAALSQSHVTHFLLCESKSETEGKKQQKKK